MKRSEASEHGNVDKQRRSHVICMCRVWWGRRGSGGEGESAHVRLGLLDSWSRRVRCVTNRWPSFDSSVWFRVRPSLIPIFSRFGFGLLSGLIHSFEFGQKRKTGIQIL